MQINLTWDASVNNAPAGFKTAVTTAGEMLGAAIADKISLNIQVGYGTVAGAPLGNNVQSEIRQANPDAVVPFSQLLSRLAIGASSADDKSSLAWLSGITDPSHGKGIALTTSQLRALGLSPLTTTSQDGSIGFEASYGAGIAFPWDFNPTDGISVGQYDLVGYAVNVLSHFLGARSFAQVGAGTLADLFSFSAPNAFASKAPPGSSLANYSSYFSVDGGTTKIADFWPTAGQWSAIANDAFAYPNLVAGQAQPLTVLDVRWLDAIGFTTSGTVPPSTAPSISFMAQLADAAYHLRSGEAVATNNPGRPLADSLYVGLTVSSQFHLLTPTDLSKVDPLGIYSSGLANGIYVEGNAAALIGTSKGALHIAFRGTNDIPSGSSIAVELTKALAQQSTADINDWYHMDQHYNLLKPFLGIIDNYTKDATNQITDVYITGHSLGAAMVQEYMFTHQTVTRGDRVSLGLHAVAFADPGYVAQDQIVPSGTDARILNVTISGDLVPSSFVQSVANSGAFGFHNGKLGSELTASLAPGATGLDLHDMGLYYNVATNLNNFGTSNSTTSLNMAAVVPANDQITELYIGYYNRAPDPTGASYWTNQRTRPA